MALAFQDLTIQFVSGRTNLTSMEATLEEPGLPRNSEPTHQLLNIRVSNSKITDKMKTNGFITGLCLIPLQKVWVICLFISGGIWSGVNGQTLADTTDIISNVQTLSLVSKHYGDSIALRWAPVKADYWYKQLHQPCLVARREVCLLYTSDGCRRAI